MPFRIDLDQIRKTEQRLGRILPSSFVYRMLRENGGTILIDEEDWVLNPIFDESDSKRVSRTCHDIIRETESARQWHGFPAHGISIATNGLGDHLLFLPSHHPNRFAETVYELAHETSEVVEIAPDFDALVRATI